jgi:hypothetical protein
MSGLLARDDRLAVSDGPLSSADRTGHFTQNSVVVRNAEYTAIAKINPE